VPDASSIARTPLWELRNICKKFPGVAANDNISLAIHEGEIHGLLGENGSGKSTLIKIICGVHAPDSGMILRRGSPIDIASPAVARSHGIATVFQEFSLVPSLTVAENISLGRLPRIGHKVDWAGMKRLSENVLARMSVKIEPDAAVSSLSVAEQQLVEIAKALAADASMLILDEPTTALGLREIARLHDLLRRLKAAGTAVIYISHRLDEVVDLVDVATILKDGRVVSPAVETKIEFPFIVQKMIGELGDHYPKQRSASDDVVLEVERISTTNRVQEVSFTVRRGEVFGIGGVLGSGRTEIARALFGIDRLTGGMVKWKGRSVSFTSPEQAIRAGIAYLPENRKSDGLFFNLTGFPNMSIARLDKLGGPLSLSLTKEVQEGRRFVKDLEISPAAETKTVGLLSGGNQQKIVIGRWLFAGAELFILDEPTQGIDIAAKVAFYKLMNALTGSGCSIILISSDHDELLSMSDRIAIVRHGRVVLTRRASEVSKLDLVRASGAKLESAA
jgi:ABC-type sugar transport system ATPase subunit